MPMVWRCSFLESESETSTEWKLIQNLESAPQATNIHRLDLANEFDAVHWEMMESLGDFDLEVATIFEDALSNGFDGENLHTSRIQAIRVKQFAKSNAFIQSPCSALHIAFLLFKILL